MVLLDYSAVGNDKLFPLVIGESENLHCFKYIRKLSTKYVAKIKAWITQAILFPPIYLEAVSHLHF